MDDLLSVVGSAIGQRNSDSSMRDMINADTLPPPDWKMNWQGKPMEAGTGKVNDTNPGGFDANVVMDAVKNASVQPQQMKQQQQAKPSLQMPSLDAKPLAEAALSAVSGIGSSITSGWRGLYELAAGHGIDQAADTVKEEQQNRTYQPETAGGQKVNEIMSSPYNPLNYFSDAGSWAGDKVLNLTKSPALATATETGINAIPLAFLRKGGGVPVKTGANPSIGEVVNPAISQADQVHVPMTVKQPAPAMSTQAAPESTNSPVVFQESAPVAAEGKQLPLPEQQQRADILKRVGLTEARESAISGDGKAGATEFQQSKLDNSAGNYMRTVIDNERQALENHAESIVKDTGGTPGLDESARYARGQAIIDPIDALKDHFDTTTRQLYQAADEKAGGQPIDMPTTNQFIGGDQADFLGTTEGESLLKGVKARMKSLGMVDENGAPQPVTVKQAEQLKQYLGNQWQPRTSRLISGMKDAIDEDVTKSGGEDIYQEARKMRYLRAQTLDDPNGIAKIMDSSGPNGINRKVNIEKIPDEIAGMPVDQLTHVINTLKQVPDEIKPQAQQAINEIKSHYANKIQDAGSKRVGQWGARDVTKYLNANAEKLQVVFTPEELAKIKDLNDAGNILAKDQSYPGAAVQEHNLVKRGAMASIRAGGAAVGGFIAGAPGAAAGDFIGNSIGSKFSESASLKSAQKKVVKLSDLPK